jgi:hypothetical protein
MNRLKACLTGVLIWGISHQLFSQQVLIGTVYDVNKHPIPGVSVIQGNSKSYYGAISDIDGEFALWVKEKEEKSITFKYIGCVPVVLSHIDTIVHPLTIIMKEDTLVSDVNLSNWPVNHHHFDFIASMAVEGMFANFSEFESALGNYNTDIMSGTDATINFEFAGTYKRFMAGIGLGFSLSDNPENDSLKVKFNTMQYNLDFGFKVLNSKRLAISPLIGLKWKRYRLINSAIDRKIPIETYLSEKDLDIRFNQTYASAGLRIEYKPKKQDFESSYWSVGVDGGFILPLNKVPWTYSRENRLMTDKELRIDNYFFRLYIAINIE